FAAAFYGQGAVARDVDVQFVGEKYHELPEQVFGPLVSGRESHDFQLPPIVGDAKTALPFEGPQQSLVGAPGDAIEPKTPCLHSAHGSALSFQLRWAVLLNSASPSHVDSVRPALPMSMPPIPRRRCPSASPGHRL